MKIKNLLIAFIIGFSSSISFSLIAADESIPTGKPAAETAKPGITKDVTESDKLKVPATAIVASKSIAKVAPEVVKPCSEIKKYHFADADKFGKKADKVFGRVNCHLNRAFFFDLAFGAFGHDKYGKAIKVPFLIFWLVLGAVYFTIRMGFINLRVFRHGIRVVMGRYSKPTDVGEVTHFQALTTALSATVGLGNIAGVAIAIGIGGPGATFWMIVAGFIGMTTKFTEATAAQMYREIRPDGKVMGGAMEYLSRGFKEYNFPMTGKILAVIFSIFCIGASLGGGNAFQVSQSLLVVEGSVKDLFPSLSADVISEYRWVYGALLAVLVGIVIIGGIKRIAKTAEAIVPTMVFIYLVACIWIILSNAGAVPAAFGAIFDSAFSFQAGVGGFIGVMIVGFQRAAFSNEAGIGSAAIAHSAAQTPYPVRQGIVASLEPFIDTVIICTMTALVIVITQHYSSAPELPETAKAVYDSAGGSFAKGAAITSLAFKSQISWFPYILSISVFLFAFSTMISWSYYGERCWSYMFGEKSSIVFKLIFLAFIVLGSIVGASEILNFTDPLFFAMALPNLIGLYLLQNKIAKSLKSYMSKLRSGEMDREAGRT